MFKNAYQLSTQRPLRRHKQWGNPLDKSERGRDYFAFLRLKHKKVWGGEGFYFEVTAMVCLYLA